MILAFSFLISCSEDHINPDITIHITSLTPNSAYIGDVIAITGTNLGSQSDKGFVSFNGVKSLYVSLWSNSLITVRVPVGAKSGKVRVEVNGNVSNELDFIVESGGKLVVIETALIPSGSFRMGNTGIYAGNADEIPAHSVTLTKSFLMGKNEITQKQYKDVVGINPSYFNGENLPVEQVNWYEAGQFCNKLSTLAGLTPCYSGSGDSTVCDWNANGWRLPTEAEWEYACRAGSTTDFYNGDVTNDGTTPLDDNLDRIAWYSGNSDNKTHEVGQKEANKFGLYDMSGNVWEWYWDGYKSYTSASETDPIGTLTGPFRGIRGGSWNMYANMCRSAYRYFTYPNTRFPYYGFRVVRNS